MLTDSITYIEFIRRKMFVACDSNYLEFRHNLSKKEFQGLFFKKVIV